jgi:charged multivesicular body protein 1
MGSKHSLMDDLVNFKMTSKQMNASARKCEKNQATQKAKLKKAIEQKNIEGARIYAQNAIREKNQSLNFLRMASRIDAVASRLETAIRMQQVSKTMGQTVAGMSNAMKSMDVEKISYTMEEFERQFADMDVKSGYMEGAMESTTAMSTPPDEVDKLIQMVADEAGLDTAMALDELGEVGTHVPNADKAEEKKKEDDLEQRLAALRR